MFAIVLLVTMISSDAKGMMRRTHEQRPMKTQEATDTSLQGNGAPQAFAANVHKNSVYMQVDASGSTQGWQTDAKETKEHVYMEMDSSAYMRKAAVDDKTPLQEESSKSQDLQNIKGFKTLVHHVRNNPELIKDLAESAGIQNFDWTSDEMHAAAHSVHEEVFSARTQSLLQKQANAHIKVEKLRDGLTRMQQDVHLPVNSSSAAGQSLHQQIDSMRKRLSVIQTSSNSTTQPNISTFQNHQHVDIVHQELDALNDEVKLLRGDVTALRNTVDEDDAGRELHEVPNTSFLKGQGNSSVGSTWNFELGLRDFGENSDVPWRNTQTGLTKSVQKLGMKAATHNTYFGLAKSLSAFITKAAVNGGVTGADVFGLMHDTLPNLLFLANPLLGAVVGVAFSVFKGVFFPGPQFITSQALEARLHEFERKILADVEILIKRNDLKSQYARVENEMEDLMEEMYWVTQMLCFNKDTCADVPQSQRVLTSSQRHTQLTYQLMMQHHLSMMKRDVFHSECWDKFDGDSCKEYRELSAGFLIELHFINVHLNVLLEMCILQPAYCGAVVGRVKQLGTKYMLLLRGSVETFKEKRLSMVSAFTTNDAGDDDCNSPGHNVCAIRGGFDEKLEKRTFNIEAFWGQPPDQVRIGCSVGGLQSLHNVDAYDLNWGNNEAINLMNCGDCKCSRNWCPGGSTCVDGFKGQAEAHVQNIIWELGDYLNFIQEYEAALAKIGGDSCLMKWIVTGDCSEANECVTSYGFPSVYYLANQQCTMKPVCDCSCKVQASADNFRTEEGWDFLTVNGQKYSGNIAIDFNPGGETLEWKADGWINDKGFKLCLTKA